MSEPDNYWTRTLEIGRLPLPVEGEQDVSLVWHQSQEVYERGLSVIGLGEMKGVIRCEYVHAKAVYFVPDLVVTRAITAPDARPGEQIGHVEDVQSRGSRRIEFANLHAWFYPHASALMLWEVDLWRHPEADPRKDFILACLFDGFERELLRVFLDAREVITPHEPNYNSTLWAEFVTQRGYEPWRDSCYRKLRG